MTIYINTDHAGENEYTFWNKSENSQMTITAETLVDAKKEYRKAEGLVGEKVYWKMI